MGCMADPKGILLVLASRGGTCRTAGGLFIIADEVQPGFGRLERQLWGFQRPRRPFPEIPP